MRKAWRRFRKASVAEKLGIQGTPATLIGDEMLSGWILGAI
jgi:protein-disulfide isomerase